MAHHKSAQKRIRQTAKRREQNRYYAKTMRNAIRKMRTLESKKEAAEKLPKVISMVDRMVKRNQIHKNKGANIKSQLSKFVNELS